MRFRSEILFALALSVTLVGSSCVIEDSAEDDDGEEPVPSTLDERPCPEDSFLTYEDFGEPFLLNWCTGCHSAALDEGERQGAPVGSNYETIALVRKNAARLWARAGDHNLTMPPVGGPESDERALFGEWLACGAKSRDSK